MDTSFALRIDANGKHWGGNNSPQGDKQQRRRQKLQALLESLKAGELDAASPEQLPSKASPLRCFINHSSAFRVVLESASVKNVKNVKIAKVF